MLQWLLIRLMILSLAIDTAQAPDGDQMQSLGNQRQGRRPSLACMLPPAANLLSANVLHSIEHDHAS